VYIKESLLSEEISPAGESIAEWETREEVDLKLKTLEAKNSEGTVDERLFGNQTEVGKGQGYNENSIPRDKPGESAEHSALICVAPANVLQLGTLE
jgi:hypothetical protein